jgi:hypothetical protein
MTRFERCQRNAVAQLIGMRETNEDVMRRLETECADLVSRGCPIHSPLWRGSGPLPVKSEKRPPVAVTVRPRRIPVLAPQQVKCVGRTDPQRRSPLRQRSNPSRRSRTANSATAVHASAAP